MRTDDRDLMAAAPQLLVKEARLEGRVVRIGDSNEITQNRNAKRPAVA